jgi:P4 family phage/plasmid primase-like protien
MNFVERYTSLGLKWKRFALSWNATKSNRDGTVGGKVGFDKRGNDPSYNGVFIECDNILAIDVDGTCETCVQIDGVCDANAVMKAKTLKGHHYIFRYDARFKQYAAKSTEPAIDTRTGSGSILTVEPSFYVHPTEGRVEYKWERFPDSLDELTEAPQEVVDYLLSHSGYCKEYVEKKPAPKNKLVMKPDEIEDDEEAMTFIPNTAAKSVLEEIDALCECLTPEWLTSFDNWLKLMYCMKNINPSAEMKEIFLRHSARSPRYSYAAFADQNGRLWDGAKANGRSSIGSLKHYAKNCNPDKYFALAKNSYWNLVNIPNANSLCEIFYNSMAGDILYSNSLKQYFVYDSREMIWKVCENNAYVNFLFVEHTSAVFRKMAADLPPARSEEEANVRKAKLKKLSEVEKMCGGSYVITLVNSFLPAFCRSEEDPLNYFNQNPDLLPLQNGVWKFSEKKLIPYEREHYFTFRIKINYNAKADTTDIRKACLDWYAQDADVAKFIQYWIGYAMTGHTTRQDFLVVWGTSAGNGKSLLWGTILSMLLDKYYRTITSDALTTERVGNNDQLYNLNGGRFAFLSEPRRAKGTKIDNEIVKTLTGDKYFTAEAKYKNAITFKLQAKFAMACNDMPEFKFEDKGTYRRVRVCEQNCSFLDEEDYAKAKDDDKDKKRVMRKDDAFIDRLLENMEGILLWALEGASMFIDNPRLEAPAAMNSAKERAVAEVDELGNWIRSNIIDTRNETPRRVGYEKCTIKFKAIKEMLRSQKIDLGQNVIGFNKRLASKFEDLGFELGGRQDKGDMYVKYALETRTEDEGFLGDD